MDLTKTEPPREIPLFPMKLSNMYAVSWVDKSSLGPFSLKDVAEGH